MKKNKINVTDVVKWIFIICISFMLLISILGLAKYYIEIKKGNYEKITATITNIEQYEYKQHYKKYIGIKTEYSYVVNGKEYKYIHESKDKAPSIHEIGDKETIYYSRINPEDVMISKYSILSLVLIVMILAIILYFGFVKKDLVLLFFIVCIIGFSIGIYYIVNSIAVMDNYAKTEATVTNIFNYVVNYSSTANGENRQYTETIHGSIYKYSVDGVEYKASELDVPNELKVVDTRTIHYYSNNPVYYHSGTSKELVYGIVSFIIF